jgi:outer membrane autotransporter protein
MDQSGEGSLPYAVTNAVTGDSVVFEHEVSGKTITLTTDLDLSKGLSLSNGGNKAVTVDVTNCTFTFGSGTNNVGSDVTFQAVQEGAFLLICAYGDTNLDDFSGKIVASEGGISCAVYGDNINIHQMKGEIVADGLNALSIDATQVQIDNCSGTIEATATSSVGQACAVYTGASGGNITIGNLSGVISASVNTTDQADAFGIDSETAQVHLTGATSGSVTATSSGDAYGIYGGSQIVIDNLTATGSINAYGGTKADGLNVDASGGTITVTTCNGVIHAETAAGPARGIDGKGAVNIGDLGGAISAQSGGENDAHGIYALGPVQIDSIGADGSIKAEATSSTGGSAVAVYSTGSATIGTLAGTVSAKSAGDAYGFDTSSVQIGTLSGRIEVTSKLGSATGLWPNNVAIETLSGTIATEGATQSYSIYAGGFQVTDSFGGEISTTVTSGCALGILTIGDISIKNFGGEIKTHGWGDSYGVNPWNGSLFLTGNTTGKVTTISDEGSGFGIYTPGDVTVENFGGTVAATGKESAAGIVTQGGDVLFNGVYSGSVTAKGTSGYAVGIWSGGNVSIPDFRGNISAAGETEAYGIYTNGRAIIGNMTGDISAAAKSGPAFGIDAAKGIDAGSLGGSSTPTLISGSISASGTSAYAVYGEGLNLVVADGATLSAKKTSSSGEAYAIHATGSAANHVELVAGCHVTGDILLNSAAADALVLSGTNGSTTLADRITADTIDVTGGKWTIVGVISENAELDILGGSLTFVAPNKLNSNINVANGSVSFNGTTTGTATVGEYCVFSGIGTVGQLINYGTVAPGNSIGTLHVTGDYLQAAGSTLDIEINDAGQCDKVDIGGKAQIGGTLNVLAQSGDYKVGSAYTFLAAKGGVSGAFDSVTDNLPFIDFALIYGLYDIQLLLTAGGSYDSEAVTFNQHGVARYLDAQKGGASGDFATVLDSLNLLDADQARLAFDAMSGEVFGSLATIGIENHEQFLRTISQRLQSQSMMQGFDASTADVHLAHGIVFVNRQTSCLQSLSGWNPWVQGYGIGGALGTDDNASGLGYSTGGVALGMERKVTDDTRLGVAGGYSSTRTKLDSRADSGSIDGGQIALYLNHCIDSLYLTGITAYGYNSYSTQRQIDFGDINRSPHASFGGNNFSFYTEAGRTIFGRYAHLQPYAALEYIQLHENDFVESGADSIDIAFGGDQADAFRGLLGTRLLGYVPTRLERPVILEGRAAWRHEFLDENRVIDASFAGQSGGAFAIAGINVDRDSAILGTGLTCCLRQNLSVYANYDVVTSENYTAHAGSGGMQYTW